MIVHVKKASNMHRTCCGRPVAGLVVRRWEPTLDHIDIDCKACRRAWQAEREQQEEIEQAQEWLEPEENPAPATQTEAFRRWFGDSKVVDENGQPLVVYHGTPDARGLFGADGSGKRGFRTSPTRGDMFFATDDQRTASSYANPHRAWDYQNAEPAVIPLYLSIQNPLVVDGKFQHWRGTEALIEKARAGGHDGAIILNTIDHYATPSKKPRREDASTVYVFFSPTQAKSAMTAPVVARDLNNWYMPDRSGRTLDFTGPNDGTFDVDDPDLRSNPPTLKVVDTEEWDDGTVVEFVAVPFPYERKPLAHRDDPTARGPVPLADLIATQRRVTKAGVMGAGDAPITVLQTTDGRRYIADGHHRAVAAWLRGDDTIPAVVRFVRE